MTRPIWNGRRAQAYAKPRLCFTRAMLAVLTLAVAAGCQSGSDVGRDPTRAAPVAVGPPVQDPAALADERALRIRHAWALLEAGDVTAAEGVRDGLAALGAGTLGGEERVELELLDAGLAFGRGDVDAVAETLRALEASAAGHLRFAVLRADVAAARGDHAGAAATLVAFEAGAGADVPALGRALWRHGTQVEGYRLADLGSRAVTVAERAWWRFLETYNEALTPARQRTLWAGWRQGHPDHPAALVQPPGLDEPGPRRIALLLPLSGRFANAGQSVRDGFLAGYFHGNSGREQDDAVRSAPSVLLYDTGSAPLDALYEEALASGAEAIVGPLSKENVARMWDLDPILPTVTLNTIAPRASGAAAPRLVQFALAVEDEGRALARRMGVDGRRRVVVFRTRADWSERAAVALRSNLPDGVELVDVGVFPDVREVTNVVGEALAIEESQARQTALARLFPGVEVAFTARRRADVSAVVALLDGDHANSLAAALRFHYAADLPVYGSSQVLRDGARALEGMRVCDLPWRLYPSSLKAALQDPFPGVTGTAESLFAFGVDAFRIVNRLRWLAASPEHRIMGASGMLGLGPDGSVHREPAWAIVRGGDFQPLPPAGPRR